jgi:hypothetical protein
VAGATLAVAVWAHTMAAGNLPGAPGLVAIWLMSALVVTALVGKPVSFRRMIGLLCAGQAGLHLLLSLVAGHGHAAPPPVNAETLRYAEVSMLEDRFSTAHAHRAGSADALTSGLGSLLGDVLSPAGLRMTALHLLAAAVVGLYLATAERLLWVFLRHVAATARRQLELGLHRVLRLLLVCSLRPYRTAVVLLSWPPVRERGAVVAERSPVSRRGPPRMVLAA